MQLQTNPYLIWQLIPGLILLGIGLYIRSRPVRKRESNVFELLMFGGSLWAFADAVQLITPDLGWQRFWNAVTFLGIMTVPTAWFLLSVKLTGLLRQKIEGLEKYLVFPPLLLYLTLLTNEWHGLFFVSFGAVESGGYISLQNQYGPLFYLHTGYSYLLMVAGMVILGVSLVSNFKEYDVQAYGLIIGVLAPLIGNAYYLFGSPPPGFPDPTPIIFTVTGVAFAWAIFGGHILEVVPLAHESIVRKLSAGVIVLDAEKKIRDINDSAKEMLDLPPRSYTGDSLSALVKHQKDIGLNLNEALDKSVKGDQELQVALPAADRVFDARVSHLTDKRGNTSGWLIQLSDISERRKAEEGMAATQEAFKTVLDSLQDSFFEADEHGTITYANKAFANNLGFAGREEVIGKNFRKFTDKNSVRAIFEKFRLMFETKRPLDTFEYPYRTNDGKIYIGETTVSPVLDKNKVIGSRGLIRDITARVNAEKEILRQKDLLDSLLQQSPIAMVINNMEKRITVVNPAFEKLFGYSQEESIGKTLDELLSVGNDLAETEELSTFLMRRQDQREGTRRRKDGTLVNVEIFAAPFFVGGERFGYLAFYTDISERLAAQAKLEKTQSSYIAVLETLQDPYFEVLTSGTFTYVNKALCEKIGHTREALLGRHFRIVASRKSVRETVQNFENMFATGKLIPPFEFIYRLDNGQELTGEMVVSPIIESDKVVGARGIIRDISARIQAEEILRQAKDAAESRAGELSAINRVAVTVSQSLDLNDILQSVCRELTMIFPIRNAGIGLVTPDKKQLEIVAFHAADPNEKSALGILLPIEGNTSSREVIEQRRTVFIQDAQNDPRTSSVADISRSRGTRSIMIVPLLARGEAIGTIGMPAKDPSHVFAQNEIELAETIASQIAAAIDNAQLHARTESALDVAERDLEIGRQIQSGFFPESLPSLAGWEIAAHFHAARQVAGDFYDVFQFKNSKLTAFIIADVCDKGVGAALFMVLFRSLLRAFSGTTINPKNVKKQLHGIVVNTSNFIAEYHGKSNMFATMFFGILDPDARVLHYVNGGHEPPIVLDKNGTIIQRLMPTGPAVGIFPDMSFEVKEIRFKEGDSLVGFTDGTTDAKNVSGNQFSEERLLNTIAVPWTSMFSMIFELSGALRRHIGEHPQFDDITLFALRRESKKAMSRHAICRAARMEFLADLRGFAESAARQSGLDHDGVFAFKLAVDELCTNIIQYGYEGGEPGLLTLFFEVHDGQARLIIQDDGKYFAPEQAQRPDLEADWEERQIGGLGIFFVKELMHNVTYNRINGNLNQIMLERKLTTPNEQRSV